MIFKHEIDNENFKGHVVIDMPTFSERIKKSKEISYTIVDGEYKQREAIDQYEDLCAFGISRVKEIYIVCGEKTFTNIEELLIYEEGKEIATGIFRILLNGASLGKKLPTQ